MDDPKALGLPKIGYPGTAFSLKLGKSPLHTSIPVGKVILSSEEELVFIAFPVDVTKSTDIEQEVYWLSVAKSGLP